MTEHVPAEGTLPTPDWLGRIAPRWVVGAAAAVLVLAWGLAFAAARWNLFGLPTHLWLELFNNRPVEWLQWVLLGLVVAGAAFLAGRLYGGPHHRAAAFFGLLALGGAFMLIEEAGDVRHVISDYVYAWFGGHIFGLPYRVVSDVPYFAALAFLPLYAVVRYGRAAWRARSLRGYLVAGYGLYGLAAGASGIRHLRGLYSRAGELLSRPLFGERLPLPPDMSAERLYFLLIDGPVEESVELLASACLLAAVVAFARDHAAGRVPGDTPPPG